MSALITLEMTLKGNRSVSLNIGQSGLIFWEDVLGKIEIKASFLFSTTMTQVMVAKFARMAWLSLQQQVDLYLCHV